MFMFRRKSVDQLNKLNEFSPKRLRTLRNSLNNRIASFKNGAGKASDLQKSHRLAGMTQKSCEELLIDVQRVIKDKKFNNVTL